MQSKKSELYRNYALSINLSPKMRYITSIERRAEKRGFRQGLLEGIELCLQVKFGSEGLLVLPEVSQIEDIEVLKAILDSIKRVTDPQELRLVYQPRKHQNT